MITTSHRRRNMPELARVQRPNPRLQRTCLRAPLSRKTLGSAAHVGIAGSFRGSRLPLEVYCEAKFWMEPKIELDENFGFLSVRLVES